MRRGTTGEDALNRLLDTLIDVWGREAVAASLNRHAQAPINLPSARKKAGKARALKSAVSLVEEMEVDAIKREALLRLASAYDSGDAFPKVSDGRAFLSAHQKDAKNVSDRSQAFKRMLPILIEMSTKGLETLAERSHHSGPTQLEPISNAIREAGESMRGSQSAPVSSGPPDSEPPRE
ncbi:hypothetical protein [Endobacter medicaginis]|uniref:hypothetical protein n=1 Tax=Endobacter medicaginis TaxID=1181271 RepID=UPI001C4002C3|nr:hypothetical protein [Endobacter medicaginis]MCX5474810.1 hypothetical protein [Endobacter medicaginis]